MDNFKTSQVIKAFFETSPSDANIHVCSFCSKVKKQNIKHGYTNLTTHLTTEHPDYKEQFLAKMAGGPMDAFVRASKRAILLHSWTRLVVELNLPFTYVDEPIVRKFSALNKICRKTLKKYMQLLRLKCQQKICKILPPTFGLMFDGWSKESEHFIAIFALFTDKDGAVTELLLSCGVQEDVDETTEFVEGIAEEDQRFGLSAADIFDFMIGALAEYNINVTVDTFKDVVEFITGDNCSTNQSLATLTKVPLVGCYSHRLNLAVQTFIGPELRKNKQGRTVTEESVNRTYVNKVDKLMGELKTQKNAALLRPKTELKPVRKNATRWSSTLACLLRWLQFRGPIGEVIGFPKELTELIPTAGEHQLILALVDDLKKFESVSKALQAGGSGRLNLHRARALFEALCVEFHRTTPLSHH